MRLQFKYLENREKKKEFTGNRKFIENEKVSLTNKKQSLVKEKIKKEGILKEFQSAYLSKMPNFIKIKTIADDLNGKLNDIQDSNKLKIDNINRKLNDLKAELAKKQTENSDLVEKLKRNHESYENFLKIHNILEIKAEINKLTYEARCIIDQIKDFESSNEILSIKSQETEKNLKEEFIKKEESINSLKLCKNQKASIFSKELTVLQETHSHKIKLKANLEEVIKASKATFLKQMKDKDNEKLQLFKEQAYKKELYEEKHRKFLELAKQKNNQINFKRLSTVDIDLEQMRQSKTLMKNSFDLDLKGVLNRKEALRAENNRLNEIYQMESLKKTSWNMKINKTNDGKIEKEKSFSKNSSELLKIKTLQKKLKDNTLDLEAKKTLSQTNLQTLINNNEDTLKNMNSIGALRIEIETKKREKQWFFDIKKEITSQNETTKTKIKDLKKFIEKTRKELISQKSLLDKYREKLKNMGDIFDKLENKKKSIIP